MKREFIPINLKSLYDLDNSIGPFQVDGVMNGVVEHSSSKFLIESAFIEPEWHRLNGDKNYEQLRKDVKDFVKTYTGKLYSSLLHQEGLYLPVFAMGFDEILLSIMKTSAERNSQVRVKGFYSGTKDNTSFTPLFLEELEFNNRILRRKK